MPSSGLRRGAIPANPAAFPTHQNLENLRAVLVEPFPSRQFSPMMTASEQARGLSRPPDQSTRRDPRGEEVSGETNGVPLSICEFGEFTSWSVLGTLGDMFDDLVAEAAEADLDVGPIPAGIHALRPDPKLQTYVDKEYLRMNLTAELKITGTCLFRSRLGEDWDVCPDWSWNKGGGTLSATAANIAALISERPWEGVALGAENPVILLPVLTGSLLFFASGYNTDIDGVEYFRLCLSKMYDIEGIRFASEILAAVSLLNVSHNSIRLPDVYHPESAFHAENIKSEDIGWTEEAKADLTRIRAKQRSAPRRGRGDGGGRRGGGRGGGTGDPASGGGGEGGKGKRGGKGGHGGKEGKGGKVAKSGKGTKGRDVFQVVLHEWTDDVIFADYDFCIER
ncbi:hypothetical protein JCM10295v2_000356 [Rhodotorula toruloides]